MKVGGESVDINDFVSEDLTTGAVAQFWDGSSYAMAYYYDENSDGGVYSSDGEECLGPGWGDEDQIITGNVLPTGSGFWVISSPATLIAAGEVSSSNTITVEAGTWLVANPLPTATNTKNIKCPGFETGTVAQFWNGTGYTLAYYYDENSDGGVYSEDGEECLGPGWGDEDQIVIDHDIAVGEGFWVISGTGSEVTFE